MINASILPSTQLDNDTVSIISSVASRDISMTQLVSLPTGAAPESIVAADLDLDGDIDLVVAESAAVTMLENSGNGEFKRVVLANANGPAQVNTANFNRDGNLDFVSTELPDRLFIGLHNAGTHTVHVQAGETVSGINFGHRRVDFQSPAVQSRPQGSSTDFQMRGLPREVAPSIAHPVEQTKLRSINPDLLAILPGSNSLPLGTYTTARIDDVDRLLEGRSELHRSARGQIG